MFFSSQVSLSSEASEGAAPNEVSLNAADLTVYAVDAATHPLAAWLASVPPILLGNIPSAVQAPWLLRRVLVELHNRHRLLIDQARDLCSQHQREGKPQRVLYVINNCWMQVDRRT